MGIFSKIKSFFSGGSSSTTTSSSTSSSLPAGTPVGTGIGGGTLVTTSGGGVTEVPMSPSISSGGGRTTSGGGGSGGSGRGGGGTFSRGIVQTTPTTTESFSSFTPSVRTGGGGGRSRTFTFIGGVSNPSLQTPLPIREQSALPLSERKGVVATDIGRPKRLDLLGEDKGLGERFTEFQTGRAERKQQEFFAGLEPEISGFQTGAIGLPEFEQEVAERGGFVSGMSTLEGEKIQVFAPGTEIQSLRLFKPTAEQEEFLSGLTGFERVQAQFSSAALSTRKLGADIAGAGGFFIGIGEGVGQRAIVSPAEREFQLSPFEAGKQRFGTTRLGIERELGIEGRQEDIFGQAITTIPFVPGAVGLGVRGVRGGIAFGRAGAGAFRAGAGAEFLGATARDISLAFSPIQPARARIGLESARALGFGTERVFVTSEGQLIKAERDVLGAFIDRDVSFRAKQIIVPTKEAERLTGITLTETKFPRFASEGVEEVFGGTRRQLSLGLQDISSIRGKPGVFEALTSETRLATITERPGFVMADIAKLPKPVSERTLGRGAARKISSGVDVVLGIGGKPVQGTDIFIPKDFFAGLRRTFRQPSPEDAVKFIRPAGIRKTPFSRTFQVTQQELKQFGLPPPPKPPDLKVIQTGRGDGAADILSGFGVGRFAESDIFTDFTFVRGFKGAIEKPTQTAGTATLELPRPGQIFGRQPLILERQRDLFFPISATKIQDVFRTPTRTGARTISAFRPIERTAQKEFTIQRQIALLEPIEPIRPTTLRPFDFGRGFFPFGFLPPIPPLGQAVRRGRKTKGRGFVFTPSFAVIQFPEIFKGVGKGTLAETGLFEREFRKLKLPTII